MTAFAPKARVALVARRRVVSRRQVHQWRAALRKGRLDGSRGEFVRLGSRAREI